MICLDKWLSHTTDYNHYQKMSINPNSVTNVILLEPRGSENVTIRIGIGNFSIPIHFKNDVMGREYRETLYNYIISTMDKGFYLDIKESDLIGKN